MSELSRIYNQYLESDKEPFDRKENRLYVTDVGKCPRCVAYRLLNEKKNPKADQTVVNEEIMFDLAEHMETTLIDALRWKGMLLGEQGPVPMDDRENWGGRYDIFADYGGRRIIEVKTTRSNAFNYALPKREHEYQAIIYHAYLEPELELEELPLLIYFDRGGSNTPQEHMVKADVWDEAKALMDDLDAMRTALPELPPHLPKEYHLRSYNKEVKEEPDHRCGYCDYSDACGCDQSTHRVAYLKDGKWNVSKAGDINRLIEFGIDVTG